MRVVIKVGTSSLLRDDGSSVRLSVLANVCEAVQELREAGHEVILVSSGAVGMGCMRMGCPRPKELGKLQAMAAVGGMALSKLYEQAFDLTGGRCAQVLLTYSTFGSKAQYATAKRAFVELLGMGVTPVVNENDVVSCEELKIGDNDNLAAMVSTLVNAHWLVLLTDVDGLHTADPSKDSGARRLDLVQHGSLAELRRRFASGETIDPRVDPSLAGGIRLAGSAAPSDASGGASASALEPSRAGAGRSEKGARESVDKEGPSSAAEASRAPAADGTTQASGKWGTGGMGTKLGAAQIATSCGASTAILRAENVRAVPALVTGAAGDLRATTFAAAAEPARKGHKRWLTVQSPMGSVVLDDGAAAAVAARRATLFSAGVVDVVGDFPVNSPVDLVDASGRVVARALVNFSASEIRAIAGRPSADISSLLGAEAWAEAVCSRGNIAVFSEAIADEPPGAGTDP